MHQVRPVAADQNAAINIAMPLRWLGYVTLPPDRTGRPRDRVPSGTQLFIRRLNRVSPPRPAGPR